LEEYRRLEPDWASRPTPWWIPRREETPAQPPVRKLGRQAPTSGKQAQPAARRIVLVRVGQSGT
jgi:hypothetical protein